MFYTWACPRRPIGTSLGLKRDENYYLGLFSDLEEKANEYFSLMSFFLFNLLTEKDEVIWRANFCFPDFPVFIPKNPPKSER
jgi:hypothetical protein